MSLKIRKNVAWCFLFIGLAGTLLFALCVILFGWPPHAGWFMWPVASMVTGGLAGMALKRAYTLEPENTDGKWHLSITDLIAIAVLVGATLAILQSIQSESHFRERGIPIGLLLGAASLGGLLVASRKRIRGGYRYLFAIGYVARLLSAMGLGAMVTLLVVALFMMDFRLIAELLDYTRGSPDTFEGNLGRGFRASLLLILPSLFACRLAERKGVKEQQPPAAQ